MKPCDERELQTDSGIVAYRASRRLLALLDEEAAAKGVSRSEIAREALISRLLKGKNQ